MHPSLLPQCPCSISNGSLCTAASYGNSRSLILSASCRKVVGVTVLSKVSPTGTSCERSGVWGSESRKLRSCVAVWLKSKDLTVSCQSIPLAETPARATVSGLLGVWLWICGAGPAGARLDIWLSTSAATAAQSSVNPSQRSYCTLFSFLIFAVMVSRMFLRIIVGTQSGQEAHIWCCQPKRSSELNVTLVSEPGRENTRFGVRLTSYVLWLEVAYFKMNSCLPCLQSMAEYGTG